MDSPALLEPPVDTAPQTVTPPPVARTDYNTDDDWRWMQAERMKPDQGVFGLYAGLWVAVVDKQVVGAAAPGPNTMTLRERVAERYGIPPTRLVLVGLEDPSCIEC